MYRWTNFLILAELHLLMSAAPIMWYQTDPVPLLEILYIELRHMAAVIMGNLEAVFGHFA